MTILKKRNRLSILLWFTSAIFVKTSLLHLFFLLNILFSSDEKEIVSLKIDNSRNEYRKLRKRLPSSILYGRIKTRLSKRKTS